MKNILTNKINYIQQLEEENKILKTRIVNNLRDTNIQVINERMRNDNLKRENERLKNKIAYLTLIMN